MATKDLVGDIKFKLAAAGALAKRLDQVGARDAR